MALDLATASPEAITTELAKYSLARQKLAYLTAIEEITINGQENWNGDKKNYQARLDHLRAGLEEVEAKLRAKALAKKCPFKGCNVNFI